jgi:hypothetical protein
VPIFVAEHVLLVCCTVIYVEASVRQLVTGIGVRRQQTHCAPSEQQGDNQCLIILALPGKGGDYVYGAA